MSKVWFITGAGRGMGVDIAKAALAAGYRVVATGRDTGKVSLALGKSPDLLVLRLDVTSSADAEASVKVAVERFGRIDVLVNNAGVLQEKPILELTDEEISDSVAVHLTGPLRLIRLLAPKMIANGYGRIVNLSSGWGSFAEGIGGPGMYGVTKAALNALTVRLANELPSAIKVNAMCPGWVPTRMGGQGATRSPEEGADTAVWLATLPEAGPTGGFFRDRKPIEW